LAIERAAALSQITQAGQTEAAVSQAAQSLNKTIAGLDTLIARTDTSLNSPEGVLPALAATVAATKGATTELARQARQNLADLDISEQRLIPAISNFDLASATLARQLPPILANVQATTGGTVRIAQNTADTAAQLDATATDLRKFADRELAPAKGAWHVVKSFLFEIAGPAASVATAAK
jgi:hypothetical protein